MTMSEPNLSKQAMALEEASAVDILKWACGQHAPRLVFATGFGAEGCVLVDMVARHGLEVDMLTMDTGLLFQQTYLLWKRLEDTYGVKIRGVVPALSVEEQGATLGERLWETDPQRCCQLRKVEPLRKALQGNTAWVSAIRRQQTPERASAAPVEWDSRLAMVKVNPLVRWSHKDVWRYIHDFKVPYNPLHDVGYPSIGCAPCTTAVAQGEDPRAGRWRGQDQRECGIHLPVLNNGDVLPTGEQ